MATPVSLRTSAYLQRCLDQPVGDPLPAAFSYRAPETEWFWDYLGEATVYQYEGLHHVLEGRITGPPQAMAEVVDDFLCRYFVKAVPKMVERLLGFERIVTERPAAEEVLAYFEEAMRCYVFSVPSAAVALARACLEQALRDTIQLPHTAGLDLDTLISAAGRSKTLDDCHLQMAREVQRIGNQVLHRQNCTPEQAGDSIVKVRAVVEKLYGPASDL
jgi:hypothetical protein